jgi:lipopolysaccharide heptosyltransferase II
VLCVRLDALGDVLMTTPAIRALKQARPGRTVTLLTSPAGAEAAALIPEVDEVIVYDAPWVKATAPRADSRPEYAMADLLRRGRFDAAVVFTVYSQNPLPSAFLCYLAGIPLRLAHCHENPYQLLTDWVPDPEPHRLVRHEVRRQLDLVGAVGASAGDERLAIRVPGEAVRRVADRLDGLGVDRARPWVLIHPGSTAPSRRYPAGRFAEAARRLVTERGLPVVFSGTAAEWDLVESIRREMAAPSASLAGGLALAELAALVRLAPVLVSNNTGPAHVAAAVGTPVVDLYALTNPQHTPWGVPNRVLFHDVPCKFCYKSVCPEGHHHCLTLVPPADVVNAACELLAGARGRREPDRADRPPQETRECTPLGSTPPFTTPPPASSATGS